MVQEPDVQRVLELSSRVDPSVGIWPDASTQSELVAGKQDLQSVFSLARVAARKKGRRARSFIVNIELIGMKKRIL